MSTPLTEIERLLPLLEMAFQAEQVRMAKVVARITALKDQIEQLDRPRPSNAFSPASKTGADMRWATWAQQRKTLINQEIALAAQQRETVRADVAAALSKLEAARQVHARALVDARRKEARRATE